MKNHFRNTNWFNMSVAVFGIFLLVSITVLFGYSLINGGLMVANGNHLIESYYLVEANCFEEYQEALDYSHQIMQKGGAGYIRYDDGFKVFVAGYLSQKEAEKVAKNLNLNTTKVYKLNLGEFNKTNDNEMNKIIKNNLIAFKYSIENLNNILIEYSKGEIDETRVKENIVLINEEIEQQIDNFNSNFYKSSDMYKYKSYILEFKECFTTILKLDCISYEFSSLARYQELSAMFCLGKMLKLV